MVESFEIKFCPDRTRRRNADVDQRMFPYGAGDSGHIIFVYGFENIIVQ